MAMIPERNRPRTNDFLFVIPICNFILQSAIFHRLVDVDIGVIGDALPTRSASANNSVTLQRGVGHLGSMHLHTRALYSMVSLLTYVHQVKIDVSLIFAQHNFDRTLNYRLKLFHSQWNTARARPITTQSTIIKSTRAIDAALRHVGSVTTLVIMSDKNNNASGMNDQQGHVVIYHRRKLIASELRSQYWTDTFTKYSISICYSTKMITLTKFICNSRSSFLYL